jgi:hypothetical protein
MTANATKFLFSEFGYTVGFIHSNGENPSTVIKTQWYMMHNMYRHIINTWPKIIELNRSCGHQSMRETVICVLETIAGNNGREPWPIFEKTPKMLTSSHKGITNYGYVYKARITLQGYLFCMFMTIKKYLAELESGTARSIFQVIFSSDMFHIYLFDKMLKDPARHKLTQYSYVYIPLYVLRLGEIRMFGKPDDLTVYKIEEDPKQIEPLETYKSANIKPSRK